MLSRRLPTADLLLHFDGTNGSTTFIDSSLNNRSVDAIGNPEISTTHSKFGGASGVFDGSSYVYAGLFDITSGDWCVDFWMRPNDVATRQMIAGKWSNNTKRFLLYFDNSELIAKANYATTPLELTATVADDVWQHVALTRDGNTIRLFVDGVVADTATATTNPSQAAAAVLIGAGDTQNETSFFDGYIDEFRLLVGSPGYTAAFTPPAAPYV